MTSFWKAILLSFPRAIQELLDGLVLDQDPRETKSSSARPTFSSNRRIIIEKRKSSLVEGSYIAGRVKDPCGVLCRSLN
jgi:hypothetical protein